VGGVSHRIASGEMKTNFRNEIIAISTNDYSSKQQRRLFKMNELCQWKKGPCFETSNGNHLGLAHVAVTNSFHIYVFIENAMYIRNTSGKWRTVENLKVNNRGGIIEQYMFNVGNEIHTMGGDENALHQIFDENGRQLLPLWHFEEYQYIRYPFCVHVRSKDMILMIGGLAVDSKLDRSFCYNNDLYLQVGIWWYSMRTKQWKRIEYIDFPHNNCSAVLSDDENHVIINGGQQLYILDLGDNKTFNLREIGPSLPEKDDFSDDDCNLSFDRTPGHLLIKTGGIENEWLVCGYIKRLFMTNEIAQVPPAHLVSLILDFYHQSTVHCIQKADDTFHLNEYSHWVMPTKDLIAAALNT